MPGPDKVWRPTCFLVSTRVPTGPREWSLTFDMPCPVKPPAKSPRKTPPKPAPAPLKPKDSFGVQAGRAIEEALAGMDWVCAQSPDERQELYVALGTKRKSITLDVSPKGGAPHAPAPVAKVILYLSASSMFATMTMKAGERNPVTAADALGFFHDVLALVDLLDTIDC